MENNFEMNNNQKIEVSVLVVVYNHREFLKECLDSIIGQQTSFAYEILIYDDASTDGSDKIIKEYQNRYDNIISIISDENQFSKGKYHTEENLIPLINGKYVAWVEGDDYWCNDRKLQTQYEKLEANPNCSICVHKTQCVDVSGKPINQIEGEGLFNEGIVKKNEIFDVFFVNNRWPCQTSSFFIRKEVFTERPIFWEKFYVGDLPELIWAVHRGDVYFIDSIMSCYRRFVPGSATDMNRDRKFGLFKAKTNAEGLLSFNEVTNGEYWSYIKHLTLYYLYQYYRATGDSISKQHLEMAKKELSLLEKAKLSIKFTRIGYLLRNVKEDRYKKRIYSRRK